MRMEIIRPSGDLKREVWDFSLISDWTERANIYFEAYSFQTKETTRQRTWRKQTHWTRHNRRENNITNPPLPPDVEAEMRSRYQEYILLNLSRHH